jgi:hypothetical protein
LSRLKYYRDHHFGAYNILAAGIMKLEDYLDETNTVPAYILAIGKFFIFLIPNTNMHPSSQPIYEVRLV